MYILGIILVCIISYYAIGLVLSTLAVSVFELADDKDEIMYTEIIVTWLWPVLLLWAIYIALVLLVSGLFYFAEAAIKTFRGKHLLLIIFLGLFALSSCTKDSIMDETPDPTVVVRGPSSAPVGTSVTFTVDSPEYWMESFKWEVPWGWAAEHPRIYVTNETFITHTFDQTGLQHVRVTCYSSIGEPPLIGGHNISIYDQ